MTAKYDFLCYNSIRINLVQRTCSNQGVTTYMKILVVNNVNKSKYKNSVQTSISLPEKQQNIYNKNRKYTMRIASLVLKGRVRMGINPKTNKLIKKINKKIHSDIPDTSLMENNMAVFTLETDYLSETGYSLDNSCQTKLNLKMEKS